MVKQLWDDATLGKEPVYQSLLSEVSELEVQLLSTLDPQEKDIFERLTDTYAKREKSATHLSFTEGFYIATGIYLELYQKNQNRPASSLGDTIYTRVSKKADSASRC